MNINYEIFDKIEKIKNNSKQKLIVLKLKRVLNRNKITIKAG